MHYIALWEHMFTNPRLVYRNNKTQKYKRNSLPKFFLYDLAVSKLYALVCVACCYAGWRLQKAALRLGVVLKLVPYGKLGDSLSLSLSLSKNEKVELT
jgi:hypothetical protein